MRQSFLENKLHVKVVTIGSKLADVFVNIPTWKRSDHGVKVPHFQTTY